MSFPPGFFDRSDDSADRIFYAVPRLVTHIDDEAIAGVGDLYEEMGVSDGDALDLMSSWISHLPRPPRSLTVLGMNAEELDANPMATERVVRDLNADPDGMAGKYLGAYSLEKAQALAAANFDRTALGARGLAYERLDQLTNEVLFGVR